MGDEPVYYCSCITAMAVSRAEFAAQSLELQAVREALEKYGRHRDGCWFGYDAECNCGFDAALKVSTESA